MSVLSRELGCGKAAVARNLRIMGVSIRGRGGDNRFSVEARRRRRSLVFELYYERRLSMRKIASILKCSFGTVHADISNAE